MKGEDQEPMLTEPTLEKLKSLRLDAMAVAWTEQVKNADVAKLSFDERLGLLVDAEWIHRESRHDHGNAQQRNGADRHQHSFLILRRSSQH